MQLLSIFSNSKENQLMKSSHMIYSAELIEEINYLSVNEIIILIHICQIIG